MKITAIKIYLNSDRNSKAKAIGYIELDDSLCLNGLRVIEGANGLFIGYPTDPSHKGEDYKQLYYPLCRYFAKYLETEILKEYEKCLQLD